VSASQIDLTWVDNATDETGYEVEQASGAAGPWTRIKTLPANATSTADTGLAGATTYFYRVRATATPATRATRSRHGMTQ